jgi:hypothetical protein
VLKSAVAYVTQTGQNVPANYGDEWPSHVASFSPVSEKRSLYGRLNGASLALSSLGRFRIEGKGIGRH